MSGFNLGSFSSGLFQGAGSVMQLYGMYEGISQMAAQDAAAGKVQKALDGQEQDAVNANVPGYVAGKGMVGVSNPQPPSATAPATPAAPNVDTVKVASGGKEVNPSLVVPAGSGLKPLTGAVDRHDETTPVETAAAPATPPSNIDRNGVATAVPTPTPAQPGLTLEQRQGIAALPVVKPIVTYDPSQAGSPLARGVLPQQATSPAQATSPTQLATYDTPPGGYAPGAAAPTAVAATPPPAPQQTPAQLQTGLQTVFRGAQPPPQPPASQPPAPLAAAPVPQGPPEQQPPSSQPQAGIGAQPAGTPEASVQPPQSAMGRLLSALNPIGSAQAKELVPGNIDVASRPVVQNPDGSHSTVQSMSFRDNEGREVLIPKVVDGKVVSDQEAIDHYRKTGQHLGIHDTEESANASGKAIHESEATRTQGITPAAPPKPADTQPAPVQPGPVQVASVGKGATVAPNQTTPSVQSESQPQVIKPLIWQRPYQSLREQRPDYADMVTRVAEEHGVSPTRLALHWWLESRMQSTSVTSSKGARGPLQVTDDTRKNVDPAGRYDPEKLEDALHLGALVIYGQDQRFGKDSVGSVLAYQGGEGTANSAARDFANFEMTHPQGFAYIKAAFPDEKFAQNHFTQSREYDPRRLVEAGNAGPDVLLKELVVSGPQGLGMTDLWRQAQSALMYAAARKGDYAGMQHAQDFVYQMSHQGALANTAAAHQALMAGDVTGAMHSLAKAHAFFPDNSYGRFGVGSDGKLYGERFDESTGKPIGKRFQITADSLLYQMMSTHNPKDYVKQVQDQQRLVETARYHDQTIAKDLLVAGQTHQDRVADRGQRADAAKLQSDTQLDVAGIRTAGRNQPAPPGQTQSLHTIDTDTTKRYGDNAPDPENSAKLAPLYSNLRRNSVMRGKDMPDAQADSIARRLSKGSAASGLRMRDNNDGTTGVYEKDSDTPIAHIDTGLARTLAGGKLPMAQQGALNVSPVGSQPQQARAYA